MASRLNTQPLLYQWPDAAVETFHGSPVEGGHAHLRTNEAAGKAASSRLGLFLNVG